GRDSEDDVVRHGRARRSEARPDRRGGTPRAARSPGVRDQGHRSRDGIARGCVPRRGRARLMRKVLAVGRKEFRQIVRDRLSLLILMFVPAFFLLLYGYALNFDVQHIRLAVEDDDRTPASRGLISAFVNSGYFDLTASVTNHREYEELIDQGDVRAVLVIPSGLERKLLSGERVPVQVILNGDNSNAAATVM